MDDAALDALIDTTSPLLGIEVRPDWRAAIRMHLRISLGHAAKVLAGPVGDHTDPAPVFRA